MATDESQYLENELLARIQQANNLLESISKINVDGINKLRNKTKQEIQFLSKIHRDKSYKKDHLTCSNLKHLEALAKELVKHQLNCTGVMINKTLTEEDESTKKMCVDMVLHGGRVWVKVVARNPKALSLVSAGEGYYGQKSIVEQAEEFVECAAQHLHNYEPPAVVFHFAYGIENDLASELEECGVIVEDGSAQFSSSLESLLSKQAMSRVQEVTNVRLNLCVSTMIAYVSAMTNGGAHCRFTSAVLEELASMDRLRPVKPVLDALFEGKELYCCQTAYDNFQEILFTLGGPGENQRADEFLKRVTIVPDSVSDKLIMSNRVKPRTLAIFGTGDTLKAVTVTANHSFVRSAQNKGVNFVVFLHESRALTEGKQLHGTDLS